MGETLINSNQLRDGGSSKEIKILNVVQTGTLTRDGAVVSGFSQNDYLQLGARVDKGILSLDSSAYYKVTTNFFLANSFEINLHFNCIDASNSKGYILGGNELYKGLVLAFPSDAPTHLRLAIGVGTVYEKTDDIENILYNQDYYARITKDENNKFSLYLGTTEDNMTLQAEKTVSGFVGGSQIYIGKETIGNYFNGYINIEKWSAKINNEYWWKGVETI